MESDGKTGGRCDRGTVLLSYQVSAEGAGKTEEPSPCHTVPLSYRPLVI